jgi:hypothetical protein
MYNEERDRLAKMAKMAIDAGIAERQVQIAEQQGEMIVTIIVQVLDDPLLKLSEEKRLLARRLAAKHLRLIDVEEAG